REAIRRTCCAVAETKEEGGRFYASGSALKRSGANDMNLDPESEGIVMRAARLAPDALRDGFFSDVARRLKYLSSEHNATRCAVRMLRSSR
ncbi:MAG: hypothetical protein WBX35_12055, partial [Pseudolabrys sp.]